ncbi:hypothetical protein HK405_004485 [Cladochytrium tenue]|nr:hypothetical protein HK405_004485 [Cladochytrium tenue]
MASPAATTAAQTRAFFGSARFAVVGASADPAKFGFKLTRWYGCADSALSVKGLVQEESKDKTPSILGVPCAASLRALPDPRTISLSVVTPPAVTLAVLNDARDLGVPLVWLQPGAEASPEVAEWLRAHAAAVTPTAPSVVISGGPCVLVLGDGALAEARAEKEAAAVTPARI